MEQSVSTLLDCSENNDFFKWTQCYISHFYDKFLMLLALG